jgi:hypothetical protein
MSDWTFEQAHAFASDLASERNLQIILPTNPVRRIVEAGVALAQTRLGSVLIDELLPDFTQVSVCLPLGVNEASLVLMSDAAMATPVSYSGTLGHEATHDHQSDRNGHLKNSWDYLTNNKERAQREAEAYACGLFIKMMLTGGRIDMHNALVALAGNTYHLNGASLSLADGILRSHIDSINAGVCPPIEVARWALAWMLKNAPESMKWHPLTK